jgi:UDP-glucose 4-epimerase
VTAALSWVVGRGGLLGSHTERALVRDGAVWAPRHQIRWTATAIADDLTTAVDEFVATAARRSWQVAWCAGTGIVASTPDELATETATFRWLLDALERAVQAERLGDGVFFYSSSAGALYAGCERAPFDETTRINPIAPYGEAKRAQEVMLRQWSYHTRVPALIGRIANLYGPGQNLDKPQGLISQLCRSHYERQPLGIYVSLDTMRDYIYVGDCANMIACGLNLLRRRTSSDEPETVVKIMASQRAVTIGVVLNDFRRVVKRAPHIVLRASTLSRFQVNDLRLRSVVANELDALASTPLPAGLGATYEDVRGRLASRADHFGPRN